MGFRENLKDELKYQGMLVKELSAKSGIPKGTIDHYLAEKCTEPIAESAVKIAQALNVSVEYLVIGKNIEKDYALISSESRELLREFNLLSENDKKLLLLIAKRLNEKNKNLSEILENH